ncbi:hypothetical protein [Mixta mediterraneensis]|nr:hypothetical protein [Mixta mediterraneensis]
MSFDDAVTIYFALLKDALFTVPDSDQVWASLRLIHDNVQVA